jgi:hypothetical protein
MDHCGSNLERRRFLRIVGAGTTALLAENAAPGRAEPAMTARPTDELVHELFASLTPDQRRQIVLPWDHVSPGRQSLTRLRMTDVPFTRRIGEVLGLAQQELAERALRALCNGEDGYRQLSRNRTFDDPNGVRSIGVNFFGDPAGQGPSTCVFTGHHLTVRCDAGARPDTAFGGPIYFGHVVHGYSRRNCFHYHTRSLMEIYDALGDRQRQQAVVRGNPGDFEAAVRFREAGQPRPGISAADLSAEQRRQVESAMRTLLSPFRPEDADRAMRWVSRNGGVEQINLAFYEEGRSSSDAPWSSWRLEGPGYVWNVRVVPHVHTYVHVGDDRV